MDLLLVMLNLEHCDFGSQLAHVKGLLHTLADLLFGPPKNKWKSLRSLGLGAQVTKSECFGHGRAERRHWAIG